MSHDGMNLKDFGIGESFYTATGEWRCIDTGTHTIIAYKLDIGTNSGEDVVFYDYEFGGCSLKPFTESKSELKRKNIQRGKPLMENIE